MPAPDPGLDRQIDEALELLRSVPFEELQRRGWHLQPNHFHWPLNDVPFLREHPEIWTQPALPASIDWNIDGQVDMLRRIAPYAVELDDVPDGPGAPPGEYVWGNEAFPRGDACLYYGLVRELRPRRVIEVGAGWSSLLLRRALAANGQECEVTLIDPNPNRDMMGELPSGWTLVEDLVQLTEIGRFEALQAGDILFYDGSHCARTGGDVNWIFFQVLPRLAEGVFIHVHDLVWPWDYGPEWVLDEGLSWNEQYFVQAFLMENSAYRVRLAMNVLRSLRHRELRALLAPPHVGSSVWIEKVSAATA
jgi:hypothetical protein